MSAALALVAALALPAAALAREAGDSPAMSQREIRQQMSFAADMAKKENWREAMFRWERILKATPDDSRLLNNLAVAYETIGEYDKAEEAYQRALKNAPDQREIRENYALFHAFFDRFRKAKEAQPSPAGPEARP
jgi:type IV pilus assembly protein PilF